MIDSGLVTTEVLIQLSVLFGGCLYGFEAELPGLADFRHDWKPSGWNFSLASLTFNDRHDRVNR